MTSATTTGRPDALPLQPKITPAIGIAGCILLIAGVALCLIGIKHEWLHVFLSTALLASLAVTVLVVYVMNPPVSDAVQGAYMVAAVLTGVIFGALALVFREVTEGLGCLLGGFCLAMWFLVLSPGGLITSTAGRGILIAVFCIASFALSFSHYTRTYSLILCTSFAGATVTILGIDCFSRAGLKEFWIYLWNLNVNEFPLGTTTYPITRGIRVEIACTIIFFILGVLSQFKIWKIVKERRVKRDVERMRDEESKDQLEAAVGRDVEATAERDRAEWEAMYGDKSGASVHVDSGVGSSVDSLPKRGGSVREREIDGIEMADIPGSRSGRNSKQHARPPMVVCVAPEDEAPPPASQSGELLLSEGNHHYHSAAQSSERLASGRTSLDGKDATSVKDWSDLSSAAPAVPAVVPLPFSIPGQDQDQKSDGNDHESLVSRATAGQPLQERRGVPVKQLTLGDALGMEHIPRVEDDRASSVAATADEDTDFDTLSAPRLSAAPSPYRFAFDEDASKSPFSNNISDTRAPNRSMVELPFEEDDEEAVPRPETTMEEVVPPVDKEASIPRKRRSTAGSKRQSVGSRRVSGEDAEPAEDTVSLVESLRDHLPQGLSKVAQTYRTNEWAKHIADADKPEVEADISGSHSPGIQVDHAFAEAARPVDTEALKPSSIFPEKPEFSRNASRASSNNPYRQSMQTRKPGLPHAGSGAVTPVYAFSRSPSAMSLNRQGSNPASKAQHRLTTQGLRNVSAPLINQPLVESPVEEAAAFSPHRTVSTPMASNINLMDERNVRLQHQPTSASFNALTTAATDANAIDPSDSASMRNVRLDDDNISLSERKQLLDEENMTLAERKAVMQQQREGMVSPTTQRKGTWPLPARMNSTAAQANAIYDSHQPRRSNTVDTSKQANMLTQWRQSLQQDAAARQPLMSNDAGRQALLHERRMVEYEHRLHQAQRVHRQSAMDMAMQSRALHGAHRDALRKMQAQANGRAPQ
ncbi:hypothetical protein BAUCODRAFT_147124 [Baudoinia panamericana UAMH 10762]|uniref:TM7S3/TM198-like domain-containing protein n=1 Tax=Baudoinia panamericana (strain UAMH 10762) TaxID=717646 RepID=M2MZ89_BAUPA|nr:uncharacterized protein BAUCODRAFT_147124 [Baudoinia panamericana UAMH 10762]EMC96928.1 hypothetical protein BAUCODRAFT_147124 [Baudoinia panamericana UAMH 10762]